jgi:hypothetical protein
MKTSILLSTVAAAALCVFGSFAEARDSSWVLCENGSLVVNALEHRADASTRSTSYALIFGARILKGELPESQSKVTLDEKTKLPSTFKGTIVMSEDMSSVTLKGPLVLDGQAYEQIDVTLPCKQMNND